MGVPKFLTLEELVRDHERLCGEVEELKKQFEGHVHDGGSGMVGVVTGPPFKKRVLTITKPGVCMDCGKKIGAGEVICKECIPF